MGLGIRTRIRALLGIDGETVEQLRKRGVKIGENCQLYSNEIDYGHGYLIEIGNDCIITHATILTHDASTKSLIGYSRIGKVKIGDNVFIAHGTVIMPNVKIGNNVIVRPNSVIADDIPDGAVVSGNPAVIVCSIDEYKQRHTEEMSRFPVYNKFWTDKTEADKRRESEELDGQPGYDL